MPVPDAAASSTPAMALITPARPHCQPPAEWSLVPKFIRLLSGKEGALITLLHGSTRHTAPP